MSAKRVFLLVAVTLCLAITAALGQPKGSREKTMGGDARGPKGTTATNCEQESSATRAFSPRCATLSDLRAHGLVSSGLRPAYPQDASCPTIESFFADRTRNDGSQRAFIFFAGLHGGIDIAVPEGTPVLAMANGTVVDNKTGSGIGGIGIILQHAPGDTGLPLWTYTEYKHLRETPKLGIGARVKMGDVVAISGKTGTEGPHYGPAGHPHLHVSAWQAPGSGYRAEAFFAPSGGRWMDPLAFFANGAIAYRTSDGRIIPAGSKVVWPLYCKAKGGA